MAYRGEHSVKGLRLIAEECAILLKVGQAGVFNREISYIMTHFIAAGSVQHEGFTFEGA